MSRFALASALMTAAIGCSQSTFPSPGPGSVIPARSAGARPKLEPPHPPIHAIHGHPIARLAAPVEGDSAISADDNGALRLWTALDGSIEPVVISGPEPRALAVAHDGDGFAAALIDGAGYLAIVRWTATGNARETAFADSTQAVDVAATSRDFLAITDDRTVLIYATDGTRRARLVPDAGEHVVALATAGDRVLALATRSDGTAHGRWIDASAGTWGATTPSLGTASTLDLAHAALAPDGTTASISRVVQDGPRGSGTTIALATGTVATTAPCGDAAPIGYIDPHTLACAKADATIGWWRDGKPLGDTPPTVATGPLAIVRGRAIASFQTQLVLATPERTRYLGYDAAVLPVVHQAPRGTVIGYDDQELSIFDRELARTTAFALPKVVDQWVDVVPIDAHHVLTLSTIKSRPQLAVYDLETKTLGTAVPFAAHVNAIDYEPATGLVVANNGPRGATVRRVDAATRSLGPALEVGHAVAFLVDPKLADGAAMIAFDPAYNPVGETVFELDGDGKLLRPSYRVTGTFAAFDRAARIYMEIDAKPAGDIVVSRHGEVGATFTATMPAMVRPDASGATVAFVGASTIALYDREARRRWMTPALQAHEVAWQDGALIAKFESGLAQLDVATGELGARHCGWGFGIFDTPRTSEREDGVVCD